MTRTELALGVIDLARKECLEVPDSHLGFEEHLADVLGGILYDVSELLPKYSGAVPVAAMGTVEFQDRLAEWVHNFLNEMRGFLRMDSLFPGKEQEPLLKADFEWDSLSSQVDEELEELMENIGKKIKNILMEFDAGCRTRGIYEARKFYRHDVVTETMENGEEKVFLKFSFDMDGFMKYVDRAVKDIEAQINFNKED